MAVKLKLNINQKLTNNSQIIVQDNTGRYTPSNQDGYGGNNGNPVDKIVKYIFEFTNLFTKTKYTQRHTDIAEEGYYLNPSIPRIANSENVQLLAYNQDLNNFDDGYYKVDMNVVFNAELFGDGFRDTEVVINTPGSDIIETYDAILVGNDIYGLDKTKPYVQGTLFLDRAITKSFTSFKPILRTSKTLILQDNLRDCVNKKIALLASNCGCKDSKELNAILEVQLLMWGADQAVSKQDINLAQAYIKSASRLCKCNNCGCND